MTSRGFFSIGAAALMAAGLSTSIRAQTSSERSPTTTTTTTTKEKAHNIPESKLRKVTIKVRDVDPTQHTVVFEAHVAPEAQVTSGTKRITIDQLKPGDEIRASFDPKTGEVMKLETVKHESEEPAKK